MCECHCILQLCSCFASNSHDLFRLLVSQRSNTTQLNSIATWSCSNTRLYLTDYAEGIAIELLHQAKKYHVIRLNATTWYVIHQNHLSEVNGKENHVIPAYTNVHIVKVTGDHKQCHCSCNRRFHNGRPCVHTIATLEAVHPQYFHPRYYKFYNSHLYDAHADVKEQLDTMVHKFRMEPKNIDIEGTFEVTEFKGIEYRNGANPEILAVAKVLVQMQNDHVPFNKNCFDKSLFVPYESNNDDEDSLNGIGDFGVFNEEESRTHVGAMELHGSFDSRLIDERVFYTKMESKVRSIAKLCETVPMERQNVLDQMTALEGLLTRMSISKKGLAVPIGSLVSSNPPIETSPLKKRIKGSHE